MPGIEHLTNRSRVLAFDENRSEHMSRWIMNGGPSKCAGCGNPFKHNSTGKRIEAQVGRDAQLYCYGSTCEQDALEAAAYARKRAS